MFLAGDSRDDDLDQSFVGVGGNDGNFFGRRAKEMDAGKIGVGLADGGRIDAGPGLNIFDFGTAGVKVVIQKIGGAQKPFGVFDGFGFGWGAGGTDLGVAVPEGGETEVAGNQIDRQSSGKCSLPGPFVNLFVNTGRGEQKTEFGGQSGCQFQPKNIGTVSRHKINLGLRSQVGSSAGDGFKFERNLLGILAVGEFNRRENAEGDGWRRRRRGMVFYPPDGEDAPNEAKDDQGNKTGRAVNNGFAGIVTDGSQGGHKVSIAKFQASKAPNFKYRFDIGHFDVTIIL